MSWAAPRFWWPKAGQQHALVDGVLQAVLFLPSLLYGRTVANRMATPGKPAVLPVVCVGNFVAGGAGKTPTALALYDHLRAHGLSPAFVSRGYGGSLSAEGARVDPSKHTASQVGDEPLLLAKYGPTYIGADRLQSVQKAADDGATCAIFDDGFQNPTVEKNLNLVVVDAAVGVGNALCHPAGPLRAPLAKQMEHADALVLIGEGSGAHRVVRMAAQRSIPILPAKLVLDVPQHVRGQDVVAFAGIGRPDKFFESLRAEGVNMVQTISFADHHPYTSEEADRLIKQAQANNARLVTTEKDAARLSGQQGLLNDLANIVTSIPAHLALEDENYLANLLGEHIAAWRRGMILVTLV